MKKADYTKWLEDEKQKKQEECRIRQAQQFAQRFKLQHEQEPYKVFERWLTK
jgi:hypothetical protein